MVATFYSFDTNTKIEIHIKCAKAEVSSTTIKYYITIKKVQINKNDKVYDKISSFRNFSNASRVMRKDRKRR